MPAHVVILPGWGGSKKTWAPFVKMLQPHVTSVEVLELPCFGDEPCPDTVWGVAEYANFVKNTLVGKSHIVLLGHSFGGQVAAYLVATQPHICEKLILSGAAIYRPKNTVKRIVFGILAKIGKWIFTLPLLRKYNRWAKKWLYRVADSPDYEKTTQLQREIFKNIIREDVSHLLSEIRIPTLIVWGTKDTYTPIKYAHKIHARIRQSNLHIIKGGTHGLHISEQEALLSTMLAFV